MGNQIFVIKQSGEREPFSEEKVLQSMARVGVAKNVRPMVLEHIKSRLHQDIKTSEIFSHITEFLQEKDKRASLRFNLKQAIFELGPTGFPFERYIARIFKDMGYHTSVDVIMTGECVSHEIDIVIEKDGKKEAIEAKFHNLPGVKTEIHVVLYTYARYLDVRAKNAIDNVWIITNTKLSEDAVRFAHCKQIKVIGWNYPHTGNLQEFVEKPRLYPITILPSLSHEEKQRLIEYNIVLCCDLLNAFQSGAVRDLPISRDRLFKARENAEMICKSENKT